MNTPPTAGTTGVPSAQSSLFSAIGFPADAFNEAFGGDTVPKAHWQALLSALEDTGTAVLDQRQDRVGRMRHEDGATFNPFDDPGGRRTPGLWI